MAQQKPATPYKSPLAAKTPATPQAPIEFIFNKDNYKLFIAAIAVVALGFVLMAGTTDIYSTTKIVIAPLVVLAGFALGFYAILKKPQAK
jgi:hypothetical protein